MRVTQNIYENEATTRNISLKLPQTQEIYTFLA